VNYCKEKIAEYEQKPEWKKAIPIITSDNFVNPPPGVDIIGLTEPEAYKLFLTLQDKGLAKDPLFGKEYYNWVINQATLEKDNYILAYEKYGLDQDKINNYDIQIDRAKHRLKALSDLQPIAAIESKQTKRISLTEKFEDIFIIAAWEKYIEALSQITPPLISKEREFIGNRKKHIGVVCSWIIDLKNMGFVKQDVSRSCLAKVLNNELKNFNMGKDGKTFDNISKEYDHFKQKLIDITK
jgi:hypothetical protein